MNKEADGCVALIGLAFIISAVVTFLVGPFITIWCINTLFNLSNPFDLWHWLAVMLLMGMGCSLVAVAS